MPRSRELTVHLSDKEKAVRLMVQRFLDALHHEHGLAAVETAHEMVQNYLIYAREEDLKARG